MKKVLLVAVLLIMAMGLMAASKITGTVKTNAGAPLAAQVTGYCLTPYGWMEVTAYAVDNDPTTGYYQLELDGTQAAGFTFRVVARLDDGRTSSVTWTTVYGDQNGKNIIFVPVAQH